MQKTGIFEATSICSFCFQLIDWLDAASESVEVIKSSHSSDKTA
jgi:hypothetical protein